MLSSKLQVIVLKRINFGEADKIVTVFSREQGKLSLVVKGVRRIKSRRAPHLEPLSETKLIIHGNHITDAKKIFSGDFNLKSLGFAFYGAEVVDKLLPDNEPHASVYELLRNFLRTKEIDEGKVKEFTLQLLWTLGFLPHGQFPKEGLNNFVEQVAEKRIKSKKLIEDI